MALSLRKVSWRKIEVAPSLSEAVAAARAGRFMRVLLRDGMRVALREPLGIAQVSPQMEAMARSYYRPHYWASAVEAAVLPDAVFFPWGSLLVFKDRHICDELDFSHNLAALPGLSVEGERYLLKPRREKLFAEARSVNGVTLLLAPRANRNYFHWHTEALTQIPFALENAALIDSLAVSQTEQFQVDSWHRQGVRGFREVALQEGACRFEVLVVLTNLFFNTLLHPVVAPALERIRQSAFSALGVMPRAEAPVFLARRQSSKRRIMLNEAALCDALAQRGFHIVDPSEMSYDDQVRTFARASLLAGAHGSGLMNLLYLPEGAPVVELRGQHAGREGVLLNQFARVLCQLTGRPYGAAFFPNEPGREEWEVDIAHACAVLCALAKR